MPRFCLLAAVLLFSLGAHARVFNLSERSVAAYLHGSFGPSMAGQDAFANSMGAGTSFDAKSMYDYGGEFGLLFNLWNGFNLRAGLEIYQPSSVTGEGKSSDGTKLFSLSSQFFVYDPTFALEYIYARNDNTRILFAAGAGYANVSLDNAYTMTAPGQAALGVGSFTEKMQATVWNEFVSVGWETHFTDDVTFIVDAGYRYFPVNKMTYKSDVTSIAAPSGAKKGDVVRNSDGSVRKMDLGGVFVGMGFRFYLD